MSIAPRWSRLLATVREGSTSAIVHVSATRASARRRDTDTVAGPRPRPRQASAVLDVRRLLAASTCRRFSSGGPRRGRSPTSRHPTRSPRRRARAPQSDCAVTQHCPGKGRGAGPRVTASPTARRTCTHRCVPGATHRVADQLGDRLVVIALRERVTAQDHTTPSRATRSLARHDQEMSRSGGDLKPCCRSPVDSSRGDDTSASFLTALRCVATTANVSDTRLDRVSRSAGDPQ